AKKRTLDLGRRKSAKCQKATSTHFDGPNLCGTLIDRDCGKLASVLDREGPDIIHDRLPFLDLPDWAVARRGGDAALIHRARRRQQIRGAMPGVVKRLNLRLEGPALLVLGHEEKLALRVVRDGDENLADV